MRTAILLLVGALLPAAAQNVVTRDDLAAVEKNIDQKLQRYSIENPMDLLGLARGLYLPGFGVAFTAEVNLTQTPMISPFRPSLTAAEIARVRAAKVKRLPELRALMREMMLSVAASTDRLPAREQVIMGVFLFYNSWEDVSGMPHRITMQAARSALIDVSTSRQPRSALDTIIQVREE